MHLKRMYFGIILKGQQQEEAVTNKGKYTKNPMSQLICLFLCNIVANLINFGTLYFP